MDIKKPQLGKVEAFAFVFQREFCNTIPLFAILLSLQWKTA